MTNMSKNIDQYVCRPDAGITKSLAFAFVQFELLDKDTMAGTGKPHTLAMTTEDAMWLLKHLQNLQKQFSLDLPEGEILELKGGPGQKN
jgi:hypothetical protein